jgi:hypothetical protein
LSPGVGSDPRGSGSRGWAPIPRNMARHVSVLILAVAAVAALTVAGLRIAHAARSGRPTRQIPVLGSSPSAEAAVFRSLREPSGFLRFQPCSDGVCYVLPRSLPLEVATARHLTEALGVRIASDFVKGTPIECGFLANFRLCQTEGIVKGEYVTVWLKRPEVRNPEPRTARNRRTYKRFLVVPGTEVEVSVLGHCLHPTQCREERQQEAAETRSQRQRAAASR